MIPRIRFIGAAQTSARYPYRGFWRDDGGEEADGPYKTRFGAEMASHAADEDALQAQAEDAADLRAGR